MYKESKIKRFLLKKPVWIVLVTLIISLITIPNIITKADVKSIKILEIEPGDRFYLNDNKTVTINGFQYNVEVTKIDMPTFISMVDEINGKYDIVVIGRNNSGLSNSWEKLPKYRDYSAPFIEEYGIDFTYNIKDKNKDNTDYKNNAKALWYAVDGYTPKGNTDTDDSKGNTDTDDSKGNTDTDDSKKKDRIGLGWKKFREGLRSNNVVTKKNNTEYTLREYYSENDITNKRANQIVNMIKSKQLVVLQSSIFDLEGTKLKSNFNQYKNYENVLVTNDLSIDNIANRYSQAINNKNVLVKPELSVNLISGGDSRDSSRGSMESRNLKFKVKVVGQDKKYEPKLILDYNGDGLFNEESVNLSIYDSEGTEVNDMHPGQEYTVEYNIEIGFIGYLEWKLEVNSKDNIGIKSYDLGNLIFKNVLGEKVNVKVLQIMPEKNECTFNMQTNSTFTGLLSEVNDYDIDITSITIKKYNEGSKNDNDIYGINTLEDLGYSIIVLGFGDNYGKEKDNQFESTAIDQLKKWNNKKYSLLFTHDTINLALLDNVKPNTHDEYYDLTKWNLGSRNLTQAFKDIVGQVRYDADLYNTNSSANSTTNYRYDEFNKSNNNVATAGITSLANIRLYSDYGKTNKVNIVNKSQVISYPFDLLNYETSLHDNKITVYYKGWNNSKIHYKVGNSSEWKTVPMTSLDKDGYNNKIEISIGNEKTVTACFTDGGSNWDNNNQKNYVFNLDSYEVNDNVYAINSSDSDKTIALTHIQWYQLNLEDENIVPLINLEGISSKGLYSDQVINSGDARNYYYTYAKNNITYSGAGHSDIVNPYEMKLFINTMIKAIRGTNAAPDVINLDEEGVEIPHSQTSDNIAFNVSVDSDFNFETQIKDDNNNIGKDIDVNIKATSLSSGEEISLFNDKIKYTDPSYIVDNLVISSNWLEGKENEIIKISSKAIDQYGVESNEAIFYIKVEGKKDATVFHGVSYNDSDSNWGLNDIFNNIKTISTVNGHSEVDFAAYIKMYNSNDSIILDVDDDMNVISEPIVYYVDNDNNIIKLGNGTMTYNQDEKIYRYEISKDEIINNNVPLHEGYCNLVVKYKAKIRGKNEYINTIKLVNQGKEADAIVRTVINVPTEDLF